MVKRLNIKGTYPVDELNLFLVLNDLKRSAIISLDPVYLDDPRISYDFANGKTFIKGRDDLELSYADVQNFRKDLVTQGLFFNKKDEFFMFIENVEGFEVNRRLETYFVASNKENLDFLVKSFQSGNDYDIGKALGYPEEACSQYSMNPKSGMKSKHFFNELSIGINSGVYVPSWLGYISHIPSKIDVLKSEYSEGCEVQGKLFEKFTRTYNPLLAMKVDGKFKRLLNAHKRK